MLDTGCSRRRTRSANDTRIWPSIRRALVWRIIVYAVPVFGLVGYTSALGNFVKSYATRLSNGSWLIEKGKDVLSLGDNPGLSQHVLSGAEDFLVRYAYESPVIQLTTLVVLVLLVEALSLRRRKRKRNEFVRRALNK